METYDFALYRQAIRADDAFQAELVRVYGKRAGDLRYRSGNWPKESGLAGLATAKHAADNVWLMEMRKGRV